MVDSKAKGKVTLRWVAVRRQDWESDGCGKPQGYDRGSLKRVSLICTPPEGRLRSWELRSHFRTSDFSSIKERISCHSVMPASWMDCHELLSFFIVDYFQVEIRLHRLGCLRGSTCSRSKCNDIRCLNHFIIPIEYI